jgi:cysteine desulfurase / selenocysteine lyase
VAVAGHKGLLGPPGTGALLVGEGFGDHELPPLLVGGTGVRGELPFQPREWPLHLEAGTMNLPGFAGLAAGVDLVLREGVERTGARRARLTALLLDALEEIPGVQLHRPLESELAAGIAAFNLAGWDPAEVAQILQESWGIVTRGGLHCARLALPALGWPRGSLRASVGWSSTEADVRALVTAVRTLAATSVVAA